MIGDLGRYDAMIARSTEPKVRGSNPLGAHSWETALMAPVVTVVGYEALGYRHMSEALEPLGSRSGASLRAGGVIRVALQHVGAARARSDGPDARPGRPPGGRGR
jgi:hypothetical protein